MQAKKIKIRKPYYGAGSSKQYGWVKDGFHIHGVGVNVNHLDEYDYLEITLEKKTTIIRTEDIRNFADRYNSYYDIKNSIVQVAVFSVSLLDPSLKPKPKIDDRQTSLLDLIK